MTTKLARRVSLEVIYNGKNISQDIAPYIKSFAYTDNESGKADDIELTLDDSKGNWRGSWLPAKGDTMSASITVKDWKKSGHTQTLPCGSFEVDDLSYSGPPDTMTVKGISVPESSSLRGQEKYKAWENVKLSAIAQDIATNAGLELLYESADDPEYDRREQSKKSDLAFLQSLCLDAGLSLKVTDQQIVIFDQEKYEQNLPVKTITRGTSAVKSYKFDSGTRETYSASKVSYYDSATGENQDYTYTPKNAPKTGKVLEINERVKTRKEAEKLAKKRLRGQNKNENKCSLTLAGDLELVSGLTIMVEGWDEFDGKYIIEKATHRESQSGYETEIEARKVLEGY